MSTIDFLLLRRKKSHICKTLQRHGDSLISCTVEQKKAK